MAQTTRPCGGKLYTYQLQPRILSLKNGPLPSFPSTAEIRLELAPAVVLGAEDGSLNVVFRDGDTRLFYDANTGRSRMFHIPPLEPIAIRHQSAIGEFSTDGSHAILTFPCESPEHLAETLESVRLALPAVLSLFLPEAVVAVGTIVHVSQSELRSQLRHTVEPTTIHSRESYRKLALSAFSAVDTLFDPRNRSLLAAVQYSHIAKRLAAVGNSPWEFAAESLLNLSKALEALFGSREDIRIGAAALGYGQVEIEGLFVGLQILRDELDVGHAKILELGPETLKQIYRFVVEIPLAINELLLLALERSKDGTWTPRATRDEMPSKDQRALFKLLEKMEAGFEARRQRLAPAATP